MFLDDWLAKLAYKLEWHWIPFKCACGHWVARKLDARSERTRWGVGCWVCKECSDRERKWDKGVDDVPSS